MSYELAFLDAALKEWRKLDHSIRQQFKAKLAERIINPHIASARLHGSKERYKIKLRQRAIVLSTKLKTKTFW